MGGRSCLFENHCVRDTKDWFSRHVNCVETKSKTWPLTGEHYFFVLSCFTSKCNLFLDVQDVLLFSGFWNATKRNRKRLEIFLKRMGRSWRWASSAEGRMFRSCEHKMLMLFPEVWEYLLTSVHDSLLELKTNEPWTVIIILKGETVVNAFIVVMWWERF